MDARGGVASDGVFDRPLTKCEGIYRALREKPHVPLAQRSNFWPLTAALYEPLWRGRSISLLTGGAFSTQQELETLIEWLELQAGECVLDAGTSAGLYARTLLKHTPGLEVHALDFSLPFLMQAQRYAARDGVAPVFVHADVHALPYRDTVFDTIVCGGSLNEFTDPSRTFSEFARVLKPEGQLFLLVLLRAQGRTGRRIQQVLSASGLRFFEREALAGAALEAGLDTVSALVYPPVSLTHYRRTKL